MRNPFVFFLVATDPLGVAGGRQKARRAQTTHSRAQWCLTDAQENESRLESEGKQQGSCLPGPRCVPLEPVCPGVQTAQMLQAQLSSHMAHNLPGPRQDSGWAGTPGLQSRPSEWENESVWPLPSSRPPASSLRTPMQLQGKVVQRGLDHHAE